MDMAITGMYADMSKAAARTIECDAAGCLKEGKFQCKRCKVCDFNYANKYKILQYVLKLST
jgi:hypothetical protein